MRKIPIKFFMVETGSVLMPSVRIDVQTQPEHSKRSCTGKAQLTMALK